MSFVQEDSHFRMGCPDGAQAGVRGPAAAGPSDRMSRMQMPADDKVAILSDDEEEQNGKYVLAEPAGAGAPPPPPAATDAAPERPAAALDCCERMCLRVNSRLLVSKVFYFFFFAAYGSLHPLLAVYYKQLGMSASRSGLLVGIRYFIEFCSAPFWGVVADRFQKGKAVLLFSVLCWLIFNCGIGFVKPAQMICQEKGAGGTTAAPPPTTPTPPDNFTQSSNATDSANHTRRRRSFLDLDWLPETLDSYLGVLHRNGRSVDANATSPLENTTPPNTTPPNTTPPNTTPLTPNTTPPNTTPLTPNTTLLMLNTTPLSLNTTLPAPNTTLSTTSTSAAPTEAKEYQIVYNKDQVESIFLLILLLIIVGEFFTAPTLTIVDTVTLQNLCKARDRYGLQRMWGSLGWGLAMLLVGIWSDHTYFTVELVGTGCTGLRLHNYKIAFIAFGVLMAVAFVVATQFHFGNGVESQQELPEGVVEDAGPPRAALEAEGLSAAEAAPEFHYGDLLRILCSVRYSSVLFVAWFMGFGYGFVFTFLYWHLEDLQGTTTLFGVCSVVSHVSELAAYFSSHKLIELVGHIR
ncbi:Major facilitator superfamily domain-containing protein 6 [Liparis tanakae]|uniref:Major facilitator superfamily domain-containing protein 6 n=1 Tax=Liparis tanakae TaxID=230148 RepID=A0A4Z2G0F3_9TELE|nr:Major facilitator superfamily domain-containing protein 6 [Liparis tanakae]